MESPFDVLGVDPDASDDAVVAAYRERVKEVHPDHGGSTAAFQRVRAAYEQIQADEVDTGTRPGLDEQSEDSGTGPADESEPEQPAPTKTEVEYLDYEALADYGWEMGDPSLFEKAADADLDPTAHGRFVVEPDETLLEAAENRGYAWPFACRGGACANCAVAIVEGQISQPVDHVLSEDLLDRDFRLSCNGIPLTPELKVVFNVKHLPGLDELRLPPDPFELAHAD